MVTGLGVAAFGPVAARFAALERGEYSSDSALESKSDPLERHRGSARRPSRARTTGTTAARFRDACRAMGEAGAPAQAWAQRCARWRRRRRRPVDADARLAAADLLVAGWTRASTRRERAPGRPRLCRSRVKAGGHGRRRAAPAFGARLARRHRRAGRRRRRAPGKLTPHADDESDDVKVRRRPGTRPPSASRAAATKSAAKRPRAARARRACAASPWRARTGEALGPDMAGGRRRRREPAGGDRARCREHAEGIAMRAEDARARARGGFGFRLRLGEKPPSRQKASTRPARSCWWAASRQTARRRRRPTAARALGARRGGATEPSTLFAVPSRRRRAEKRSASATLTPALANPWVPVPRVARLLLSRRERARALALRVRVRRPVAGAQPGDVPPRAAGRARWAFRTRNTRDCRDCRDCRERRAHRRLALAPRPAGTKRRRENARDRDAEGRRTSRPLSVCGVAETTKAATRLCVSAVCPRPRRRRARG